MIAKIKEIKSNDLPREKAIMQGINRLSNHEILAILLRTGTQEKNVLQLAGDLLIQHRGLLGLSRLSYSELIQIKGLKEAKALTLIASFELAKRIQCDDEEGAFLNSPKSVFTYFHPLLSREIQEKLYVAFLNVKNRIVSYSELFVGGLDSNIIHPRDIFRESVRNNAARIILIHNHPSGDPTPSKADINITLEIMKAGDIIGIRIVDHIIIGKNQFVSLKTIGAI